jgi:nucleoside-diphosphate-sugar epimerase
MRDVLVTGGTGFVGKWMQQTQPNGIVSAYTGRDKIVVINTAFEYTGMNNSLDAIIHLSPTPPTDVIPRAKRDNARLLYCSSGIVYHPENDTEYRRNKIAWEQECLDSGADVVIARLFTFYNAPGHAHAEFKKAAAEWRPIRIFGNGHAVRSYMSGEDMGMWLWAILLRGKSGEAYDVGSDRPITMLHLAQSVAGCYTPCQPIIVEGGKDAMPVYLPPDTAKTRALLR